LQQVPVKRRRQERISTVSLELKEDLLSQIIGLLSAAYSAVSLAICFSSKGAVQGMMCLAMGLPTEGTARLLIPQSGRHEGAGGRTSNTLSFWGLMLIGSYTANNRGCWEEEG